VAPRAVDNGLAKKISNTREQLLAFTGRAAEQIAPDSEVHARWLACNHPFARPENVEALWAMGISQTRFES
jgi:hypothetical protein